MQFRATLINPELLLKTVQVLDKAGHRAVLWLSPAKLQFIHIDATEGTQVRCQMGLGMLLENWRVESLADNVIGLHVLLDDLARALKSTLHASETLLKLTKRGGRACLSFQMQVNQVRTGQPYSMAQEVFVDIVTRQELEALTEPTMPDAQVYISLPPLAQLRPIVEKLRALGGFLHIMANNNGELRLAVENDLVEVQTFFTNLKHPERLDAERPARADVSREDFTRLCVDMKQFVKFLQSSQMQPTHVVCGLFAGRAVVLYVYVGALQQQPGAEGTPAEQGVLLYHLPIKSNVHT